MSAAFASRTYAKIAWRILPLLMVGYVLALLDRLNVSFAKLQMASELGFSDAAYGFGAGVFFLGYFIFEVPSNLLMQKLGARVWLARIMVTWGIISACFAFTHVVAWGGISAAFGCTDAEFTFYILRFLLGVAEAGFFPGAILYLTYWFPAYRRQQMFAIFVSSGAVSSILGGPLSGGILQFMDGFGDLRGWQWLFLIEGVPTIFVGVLLLALLPNGPATATWLAPEERDLIAREIAEEHAGKQNQRHSLRGAFADWRLWALCAIWMLGNIPIYAIAFWIPTMIAGWGVPPGDYFAVGLLMVGPSIISIITQILWARHSDRTGERRFHTVVTFAAMMLGFLGFALFNDAPLPSLIAYTFFATGASCFSAIFWSLPPMFLTGAAAAAGIAWISSVGALGGFFGPDLVGRIRMSTGGDSDIALYMLVALLALGAMITLLMPKETRSAAQGREPA
jgi:MFS family permease